MSRRHSSKAATPGRALITDFSDHFKCIRFTVEMLEDFQQIHIILKPKRGANYDWRTQIDPNANWLDEAKNQGRLRLSLTYSYAALFLSLFRFSRRSKLVYLVTGPEHGNIVVILGFWLVAKFFGHKSFLMIRNPYLWLSGFGMSSRIRSSAMRKVALLGFETKTQLESFAGALGNQGLPPAVVVCDGYLPPESEGSLCEPESTGPLRIGLLGTLNPSRRDYSTVVASLRALSFESKEGVEVVCLGAFLPGISDGVVKSLGYAAKLIVPTGWLSAQSLFDLGQTCHVLLSPLHSAKPYGTLAGSGSLGDALFLRRFVILPHFADPLGEFVGIAKTYDSQEQLISLLQQARKWGSPSRQHLDQFSLTSARESFEAALDARRTGPNKE